MKSADGTSGTFTVDSGTSVNGGEMGIGSVKTGDTVRVTAVVSGGTVDGQAGHRRDRAEGQRWDLAADAPPVGTTAIRDRFGDTSSRRTPPV